MDHNLDYKSPPKYKTYAKRAETRFQGQAVITEIEFYNLTKEKCHYCDKDGANGIDRVNNSIGRASAYKSQLRKQDFLSEAII